MSCSPSKAFAAVLGCAALTGVIADPIKVIDQDWADPSILLQDGIWYSYATGAAGKKVQVAIPWNILPDDGMPTIPGWVVPDATDPPGPGSFVWAPDVVGRDDGKFILYFSAARINTPGGLPNKGYHCVGAAIADSPTGPFVPQPDPLACPIDQGGAIDPAGFRESNGDVYVLYKIDGNNIGDGSGICGQSKNNPVPTPIMLQKLQGDWMTPDGAPTTILDRDDNDGPLIEAPSLNLLDGTYYLFFSSNCYSARDYDVSYATAKTVNAMYEMAHDPVAPLLISGDFGLSGPGGADVNQHGNKIAFHADLNRDDAANRGMWVATIEENNGEVRVV
ncbi:putative arabinan-endo 1,5-alpha-L-arabinase [Rhexocercosporidium sp. MPI-PUGE-AT-0058]|nr:putative arabinan-endo 1,5-alpha-L-arabinase [Rhexocercosporidium sp. MPI-PUGE-AT-0058]